MEDVAGYQIPTDENISAVEAELTFSPAVICGKYEGHTPFQEIDSGKSRRVRWNASGLHQLRRARGAEYLDLQH